MALIPLTNDRWGFESNCFVCEARNDRGLQLSFHHDTDADVVVAEVCFDDSRSGAPSWVHGGVVLAALDEAMAWATIASRHRWAVTKTSQAWFDRPVLVGQEHRVEARVTGGDVDGLLSAEATITRVGKDRPCVRAEAVLSVVTAVQAPGLGIGELGDDAGFVAGRPPA